MMRKWNAVDFTHGQTGAQWRIMFRVETAQVACRAVGVIESSAPTSVTSMGFLAADSSYSSSSSSITLLRLLLA